MRLTNNQTASKQVRSLSAADYDFALGAVPRNVAVTPGTTEEVEIFDAVFDYSQSSSVDFIRDVSVAGGGAMTEFEYESLDPSIATVDATGAVTRVSDGTARINVSNEHIKKQIGATVSRLDSQPTYDFKRCLAGTLGAHMIQQIDSRIAGKTLAVSGPIFTTQNHATATYLRNESSWLADVDLTCVSPWNSLGGNQRCGTLVAPGVVALAYHYRIPEGHTIRFVNNENEVVTRTVAKRINFRQEQTVNGHLHWDNFADTEIAILNEDITEAGYGIKFAKVMPVDALDYIRSICNVIVPETGGAGQAVRSQIPAITCVGGNWTHPNKIMGVSDFGHYDYFQSASDVIHNFVDLRRSANSTRSDFYVDVLGGDSGNPMFALINGELVLMACHHQPNFGPTWGSNAVGINAKIAEIWTTAGRTGTPQTLTAATMVDAATETPFTNYGAA